MTPSEKNLFHEISIHYQPQLVQIVCDQNLKDYLREKGNGSLQLADYILKEYQNCQHTPLKISRDSLAIEILAHTYPFSVVVLGNFRRFFFLFFRFFFCPSIFPLFTTNF